MIEDRIYTTEELVEMGIYTTDFEFMDKPCEVEGTLVIKGAARKGMYRLFFLLTYTLHIPYFSLLNKN